MELLNFMFIASAACITFNFDLCTSSMCYQNSFHDAEILCELLDFLNEKVMYLNISFVMLFTY